MLLVFFSMLGIEAINPRLNQESGFEGLFGIVMEMGGLVRQGSSRLRL